MFGSAPFWIGSVYVCFPLGLLIYGWNDIGDRQSDRDNPRKDSWLFGAKPSEEMCRRLPWIIAAVQVPFLLMFVAMAGPKMIGWMAAVVLVNATYNSFGFKKLPGLDLLNQVGYLLIFVLASWLCSVPQLNAPVMIFSTLFAMQSHLFGQLMDIDEDANARRRSTAILLGVRRSKFLMVAIMLAASLIAYQSFRFGVVALFMLAGATFFAADALVGPKRYPIVFSQWFFIAWNVVVIATMHFVWRYQIFLTP